MAAPVVEKGRIKSIEMPAGTHATTWHVVPYDKLTNSHTRLLNWIADQKLTVAGPCLEIYWTDPGIEPDSTKWRTQLLMPVKAPGRTE